MKSGEAIGPSRLEDVVGRFDLEAQVVNGGPPASPEFSGKRKREESTEAPRPHQRAKFEHEVETVSSLEPVLMPSAASEDANEQQRCQECGDKLPKGNEEPKAEEDIYRQHCHYGLKSPVCSQCDKHQRSCQLCENIIPQERLMDGYMLINESRVCVEYDEDIPICEGCAHELMESRLITVYCENCNERFQSGGYTNHWGRFDPLERLCEVCLDAEESYNQESIEALEFDKVGGSGQANAIVNEVCQGDTKEPGPTDQVLESHPGAGTSQSNTDELPKCRHCSLTFRLIADKQDHLGITSPFYSELEPPICPACTDKYSKCQNCNEIIPLDELGAGYNYLEENVGLGEADFDEAEPICCDCAYTLGQEQNIDWVCENCGNEFETTGGINNWQQLEPNEWMCEDCREGGDDASEEGDEGGG